MANSTKNTRRVAKHPMGDQFNKRENRITSHAYSCLVSDSAYTILDDDGITHVRNSGAVSITLPDASANVGRVIHFLQADLAQLTIVQGADGANIDGADASFTGCDAADDQVTLFCTGTEWVIVAQNIA